MNKEKLTEMALKTGFEYAAPLDVSTIVLKQEVRDMCADNTCGQHAKRWSCPPGCGSLEECEKLLREYGGGVLVQSVGDIEDGFDFEAMMEIEASHKERFAEMHEALKENGLQVLPIGAGCCTICPQCTYPDAPCRFPEKKISSMEAFGMLVLEVCKANNLEYYYGGDKMAYTSCFLVKPLD